MSFPVILPGLGEEIESATISAWLKAIGETVAEGEALVEVSTDKVDTEIESPAAGVLIEIKLDEDEVAKVGDVIAVIASGEDESAPAPMPPPIVASVVAATTPAAAPSSPAPIQAVAPMTADDSSLRGTTQNLSRLRKTIATRMV